MRLDEIIAQADAVIEKRASAHQVPPVTAASNDEEIVKLASFLMSDGPTKVESSPATTFEMTFVEKLACSVAMVEALSNVEEFMKVAEFKDKALQSGYTQDQVDAFLEKRALAVPRSVAIPALAAVAAGAAGEVHGRKKGYNNAISDIQSMYSQQG
jgi:hypothetical protein